MKSKKDSYTMQLMSQRYQYVGQRDWGRVRYSTLRMISFPIVDDLIQNSIFSNIYNIRAMFRRSNVALGEYGNEIAMTCDYLNFYPADFTSKSMNFNIISQDYRFKQQ